MTPISTDQVIRVIATKGPVLPVQVSKELGGNTMLAGALLSQLVGQKKVFVSGLKVGGSPVYYLKEQAYKLQDFVKYLNEKDRKTYDLLRQNKILKDNEQSPLVRVSLRSIKDFAIPLEVIFGDENEIFWKWYLLNEDDARELIRGHLKAYEMPAENKKPEVVEEKKVEKIAEKPLSSFVEKKEQLQPKVKEAESLPEVKESDSEVFVEENIQTSDAFLSRITSFLKGKEISIKNFQIKKKNSEIDLVLFVPSAVGQIEYYCRAKNKKSINDADISSAYVQGQLKKLPPMLLTTGEMTKKANELISKEIKISIVKM